MLTQSLLVLAQLPQGVPGKDNPGIVRDMHENACRFADEYSQIKRDKADPRVAYVELHDLVSDAKTGFTNRCKTISNQTDDSVALFDRQNGYLAIVYGIPVVNTTVTYFSGSGQSAGVILYVDKTDERRWSAHVFRFGGSEWLDETQQYLRPLKLEPNDYVLAPEFGRTLRILSAKDGVFHHKAWARWDGKQFMLASAPAAWRCPGLVKHLDEEQRRQFCAKE